MKKILKTLLMFSLILLNKLIPYKNLKCSKNTKRCSDDIKNKNFKYYIFGKDTPSCCLNNLKEIMEDTIRIFSKYNKIYFIVWGTLLGAVRHRGFIPWDTDIDVGILENECEEILKILEKELGNKYYIDTSELSSNRVIRICFSKINTLHVDIEVWDKKNGELHFYENGKEYIYKEEIFFPLKYFQFENLEVLGPRKEEKFLKEYYGQNFKTRGYKKYALLSKEVKI
mgnify:CR=1 FL=1